MTNSVKMPQKDWSGFADKSADKSADKVADKSASAVADATEPIVKDTIEKWKARALKAERNLAECQNDLKEEQDEVRHYLDLAFVDAGANPPATWKEKYDKARARVAVLEDAADYVLQECQVAAPGLHWRWHDEYYEAFKGLTEAVKARAALQPSGEPELLQAAKQAAERLEARKDEDVEEWAKRLAADSVAIGEAEYGTHHELPAIVDRLAAASA